MKLYMVTGFLGAGKTTAMKHLLGHFADKKVALIVNEYGKEGIDGKLLQQEGTLMEEIVNGSIFCACKIDKFESTLENVITKSPEIILVETSGLSDTTAAYHVLTQPKFQLLDYRGCIAIVDAVSFHKVVDMLQVCKKQVRMADLLVVNKVDLVEQTALTQLEERLAELNPQFRATVLIG